MNHDEETFKAMQGSPYDPGVDDPCPDLDCKGNSYTGCKIKGECLHRRKASKKKLLEKLAHLTTPPAQH